jgi:hypothetical protein
MGRIDEAVAVLVDQAGAPTHFRWREKDYQVSSRPVRWFARAEWWVGERAHRGIGSGAVEVEMWRFLATCEGELEHFELLLDCKHQIWKINRQFTE